MARSRQSGSSVVERLNDGSIPDPLGLGRPTVAFRGRRLVWDVDTRRIMGDGYMWVKIRTGDNGNTSGTARVYEHRLVMERLILGRPLKEGESARHRNGDSLDNRPENLILYVGAVPAEVQPAVVIESDKKSKSPQRRRKPRSRPYAVIPVPDRVRVVRARSAREAEDQVGYPAVAVAASRLDR